MNKINLRDITFLFLIKVDSIERLENILLSISFINRYFDTNIKILEVTDHFPCILPKVLIDNDNVDYTFEIDSDDVLFRTKYLNNMMQQTETEYVAIWDTDIIIPYIQVVDSINLLRSKSADFVYPYKGYFLNVPSILRKIFLSNKDIEFLIRNMNNMERIYGDNPVGGAFMCRLSTYKKVGLENEHYYGWGREDGDRYYRWQKSGFAIKRVDGVLFHLSHPRNINSRFVNNTERFNKLHLANNQRIKTYNKLIIKEINNNGKSKQK